MGLAQQYTVRIFGKTCAVESRVGMGRNVGVYRIVNLTQKTCTCGLWQGRGWGCIHAVAAWRKIRLKEKNGKKDNDDLTPLVSIKHTIGSCFHFYDTLNHLPLIDTAQPLEISSLTYPVVLHAQAGRPKLDKRIIVKTKKNMRCSRCYRVGHNTRF